MSLFQSEGPQKLKVQLWAVARNTENCKFDWHSGGREDKGKYLKFRGDFHGIESYLPYLTYLDQLKHSRQMRFNPKLHE